MEILGVIIAGIIIGLLGKFVAPGDKDNIPIWLTIVCGIGGVLIGWFVYDAFGGDETSGVDWVRWIVAILVAAVLVVIASTVTGRNTSKVSKVKSKSDLMQHRTPRAPTDDRSGLVSWEESWDSTPLSLASPRRLIGTRARR